MIKQTKVSELNKIIGGGECQVIDVREFSEFNSERIAAARLMPMSDFENHIGAIDASKPIYIMCRSGNRANTAAETLAKKGLTDVHVVEGGMVAWAQANLPIIKGESKIWSLERQVRFTAGMFVLTGVVLSLTVHPMFLSLSAFIGAGLMFSAVTDTCTMGMILARMPWNQR